MSRQPGQYSNLDFSEIIKLFSPAPGQLEALKGKSIVLFIGRTGAGKSTLVNYLRGVKMKSAQDPLGRNTDTKIVIPEKKEEIYTPMITRPEEVDGLSLTFYPAVVSDPRYEFVYCDCPGFEENRTREHAVCTTIMTQLAVQLAGSIKAVVICLPENDLEDRALEFGRLVSTVNELFKNFDQVAPSVFFAMTKLNAKTEERMKGSTWSEESLKKELEILTARRASILQHSQDEDFAEKQGEALGETLGEIKKIKTLIEEKEKGKSSLDEEVNGILKLVERRRKGLEKLLQDHQHKAESDCKDIFKSQQPTIILQQLASLLLFSSTEKKEEFKGEEPKPRSQMDDMVRKIAILTQMERNRHNILLTNPTDNGDSAKEFLKRIQEIKGESISKKDFRWESHDMVRLDFENLINEKAAEGKKEIHDRTQLKNRIDKEEAELRKKEQELIQQSLRLSEITTSKTEAEKIAVALKNKEENLATVCDEIKNNDDKSIKTTADYLSQLIEALQAINLNDPQIYWEESKSYQRDPWITGLTVLGGTALITAAFSGIITANIALAAGQTIGVGNVINISMSLYNWLLKNLRQHEFNYRGIPFVDVEMSPSNSLTSITNGVFLHPKVNKKAEGRYKVVFLPNPYFPASATVRILVPMKAIPRNALRIQNLTRDIEEEKQELEDLKEIQAEKRKEEKNLREEIKSMKEKNHTIITALSPTGKSVREAKLKHYLADIESRVKSTQNKIEKLKLSIEKQKKTLVERDSALKSKRKEYNFAFDIIAMASFNKNLLTEEFVSMYRPWRSEINIEDKYEAKEKNKPHNTLDQLLKAFQIWDDGGLQEAINRSLEERKPDLNFEKYVKSFGLDYRRMRGDGKCFCRAVYNQLQGTSVLTADEKNHTALQSAAIQYILDHVEEFKESITGSVHTFILRELERKSEWADHHIIHALAKSKRLTLVILNSNQSITVFRHPNAEKTVYLSYKVGLHYDSAPLLPGVSIHTRLTELISHSAVGEWTTHSNISAPLQEGISTESKMEVETSKEKRDLSVISSSSTSSSSSSVSTHRPVRSRKRKQEKLEIETQSASKVLRTDTESDTKPIPQSLAVYNTPQVQAFKEKLVSLLAPKKHKGYTFTLKRVAVNSLQLTATATRKRVKTQLLTLKKLFDTACQSLDIAEQSYQITLDWKNWILTVTAEPSILDKIVKLLQQVGGEYLPPISQTSSSLFYPRRESRVESAARDEEKAVVTCALQ